MPGPEKEAEDILEPILAVFRTRLQAIIMGHAVTAYLRGSAQMIQYGRTILTDRPIFFEGPPMQQAINYANKHAAQLVTKMDTETKERLAKVIGDAIKEKRGIPGLARDIRKEFDDMTKYRSELIAKTETRDALFHASQERMEAMGITGKEWVLGSGGRGGNCEDCKANTAVGVISVDEEFPTPQYDIHPGCTCHPPETVIWANDIKRIYRRWYEGDLIQITTAGGYHLSATPNHPILTDTGFVPLCSLSEGDYVIDCGGRQRMGIVYPDVDDVPTPIGQLYDALALAGFGKTTQRVIGSPMQFHGDGREGQVDIISLDNALSHREISSLIKHTEQFNFPFAHRQVSLASNNGSLMGVKESCVVGLVAVATRNIGGPQSGSNRTTVNPKGLRQTKLGFACDVAADNCCIIQTRKGSPAYASVQSSHDSAIDFIPEKVASYQYIPDTSVPDVIPAGYGFDTFSGYIIRDRIINIKRRSFAHYVYNLQTKSGCYLANGIIAHNCGIAPAMLNEAVR